MFGLGVHFIHGGSELFHGAGRLCRALRQGLTGVGNLPGAGIYLFYRDGNLSHSFVNSFKGLVESVFNDSMITFIITGDCDVQIAHGHFFQTFNRFINRLNYSIKCLIETVDDFTVFTSVLRGVGPGVEPALHCRLGQVVCIVYQTLNGLHHLNKVRG
ncbi:hypothetical protein Psfp_03276 [Pelotomaculum sp. FP]|nr:hypothetical protein Psfp_03276 [Pelotomaculum sp. FP]